MYDSGTLSGLIGTVDQVNASYTDTWDLASEIRSLSVNSNPKFLTDMKGALWMVETSGAVTAEVGVKSKFLPIKVTLPWVEVGDASQLSIVSTPADAIFKRNQIDEASLYLDIISGNLVFETPDDFVGTSILLRNGELSAQDSPDTTTKEIGITKVGNLVVG